MGARGAMGWQEMSITGGNEISTQAEVQAEYILGPQIGSGSFARVWKATRVKDNTVMAVKEIFLKSLSPKLLDCLECEIAILKRTKHPNIIRLHAIHRTECAVFLVMEYCSGGDLAHFLQARRRERAGSGGQQHQQQQQHRGSGGDVGSGGLGPLLGEEEARGLMQQLTEGLKTLRRCNLVHRDLKPQNLLLTSTAKDATLKIADFGFARSVDPQDLAETLCGSPLYMAPEILKFQKYDAKADLWSVGTILYEMLCGRPPYGGSNHIQLIRNIEKSEARIPDSVSSHLSPACLHLIRSLLRRDPIQRLSFEELFSHPFMSSTNKIDSSVKLERRSAPCLGPASSDMNPESGSGGVEWRVGLSRSKMSSSPPELHFLHSPPLSGGGGGGGVARRGGDSPPRLRGFPQDLLQIDTPLPEILPISPGRPHWSPHWSTTQYLHTTTATTTTPNTSKLHQVPDSAHQGHAKVVNEKGLEPPQKAEESQLHSPQSKNASTASIMKSRESVNRIRQSQSHSVSTSALVDVPENPPQNTRSHVSGTNTNRKCKSSSSLYNIFWRQSDASKSLSGIKESQSERSDFLGGIEEGYVLIDHGEGGRADLPRDLSLSRIAEESEDVSSIESEQTHASRSLTPTTTTTTTTTGATAATAPTAPLNFSPRTSSDNGRPTEIGERVLALEQCCKLLGILADARWDQPTVTLALHTLRLKLLHAATQLLHQAHPYHATAYPTTSTAPAPTSGNPYEASTSRIQSTSKIPSQGNTTQPDSLDESQALGCDRTGFGRDGGTSGTGTISGADLVVGSGSDTNTIGRNNCGEVRGGVPGVHTSRNGSDKNESIEYKEGGGKDERKEMDMKTKRDEAVEEKEEEEKDCAGSYFPVGSGEWSLREMRARLQAEFLNVATRVEEVAEDVRVRFGERCDIPDAIEVTFQMALVLGRAGGVEELIGNYNEAASAYAKACTLFYFFLDEAPSIGLDPPVKLSSKDQMRLRRYACSIGIRHASCVALSNSGIDHQES